jgi:adenylylsulfate kinase
MVIQLCGLSGAGKTTLTQHVRQTLTAAGVKVEIIDGDEYRRNFCRDLGFSREDRLENIRRLALIASKFSAHGIVSIISAINPYEELRAEIRQTYPNVNTIYIECPLEVLISRDTKGLYKRALLPEGHPDKLRNLTGVNDPFDIPQHPDLVIHTGTNTLEYSVSQFAAFIISRMPPQDRPAPQPSSSVAYEK